MQDPIVGTWKLNTGNSKFDAHHRPRAGTMTFEVEPDGHYRLTAQGIKENGETVTERPARFIPDGQEYPVPDFAGLKAVFTRPNPNTIVSEVRREDGSVAAGGSYAVSADGKTLTASTFGFDSQLREFRLQTVWDRVQSE